MTAAWKDQLLGRGLAVASGVLMGRDAVLRVTRRLRRHGLAEEFYFSSGGRRIWAVYVPGAAGALPEFRLGKS